MKYKKGISGNPTGRPTGTPNKVTSELREKLTTFLENKWIELEKEWKELETRDKFLLFGRLLAYSVPKLSATDIRAEVSDTTPYFPVQLNVTYEPKDIAVE
jgi:hypothetical protein